MGSDTPKADAEVIAAAIEALYAVGIKDFQVEIGQVAFFNGLVEQAGLCPADIERLRERIDCKDSLGIRELTEKLNLDSEIKSLMIDLPELFGDLSVVDKADVDGLNSVSKAALDNLRSIYVLLGEYGFKDVISVDLGMLQSIDYYTGSIFKCYTHGVGFPVCAGGRYNNLVGKFGRDLSAVGVAFGINRILSALRKTYSSGRKKLSCPVIFAAKGCAAEAYSFAKRLREKGGCCELYIGGDDIKEVMEYSKGKGAQYVLKAGDNGLLEIMDLEEDKIIKTMADDFLDNYR